ncbi:AcrR family transcriptional regulator [Streptosporangium becharense]|uniref:AcrR family transcriptional regulator n=1 Tax=Streptosporangium becharense TaxID=1816182 RepID=A0A7W9MF06_9ACTN|nr:terpene synthase family protein [Streptosporangium becharense]MBB2913808.1 AcrR family transcriptional regulator [Streptosporangium becharense]MBB5817889.1 AcrR family transcriptional regulator [Streptosporangium becharense]
MTTDGTPVGVLPARGADGGTAASAADPVDARWFGLDVARPGPAQAHRALEIVAAADTGVVAVQLTGRMQGWMRRLGPPFVPGTATLCCLTAANGTPWLPASACYPVAQTAAWLLALDAWSDGPGGDAATVEDGVARCLAVVRGGEPGDGDPLALSLAEIRDHVRGGPSAATVYPWWQRAAAASLVGTRFERRAADAVAAGGAPPRLEEYLRYGGGSIGLGMIVTAAWSAMAEPGLADRLPALQDALQDASIALRLANDLRGHEREQAEGTLDALALGLSPRDVAGLLTEHLDRCRRRLRTPGGDLPGSVLALERHLIWGVRMYQRFAAGHTG